MSSSPPLASRGASRPCPGRTGPSARATTRRKPSTWSTETPRPDGLSASRQQPGQWLAVDLGAPELVTRVDLLAIDWQNVPAGLRVEASLDGQHWNTVSEVPDYWGPLFFSEHHAFLKVRRGRVQAIFPPVRAQHVRFVQTGIGPRSWAARELFVYGPGGARPPRPPARRAHRRPPP